MSATDTTQQATNCGRNQEMTKMKAKFCVYASTLVDAIGRTSAPGDGITRSCRRLYALAATRQEAEAALARLNARPSMQKARIPGDPFLKPELEIDEFNPLDFVGRQDRDNYTGKRYAQLCFDLESLATKNSAGL